MMFQGKRALITGASRGIGAACARLLAAEGAQVGVHYVHHADAARAVAQDCGTAQVFQADLSQLHGAKGLMPAFLDWAGGIDILINNAGGVPGDAAACRILNLDAPVELMTAAWPVMQVQGAGAIVNVSSVVAGRAASARLADYAVAKAGLEQATRTAALAGGPVGIRVNAVRPGVVDTDLNKWIDDPTRTKFAERVARIPMGRAATAAEIAAAIAFLASNMARYVTGTTLTLAGGE